MNNDIVVEMKTDKANEEAGLLNKRPSTEQVRGEGLKVIDLGLIVREQNNSKLMRLSLSLTYTAPVFFVRDLISSVVQDVSLTSALVNVTHDATC